LKEERGPVAQLLRPVIDTFSDSAVAVTGCRSAGMARETCEYDVIIVTDEPRAKTSIKVGDLHFDLFFVTEAEALRPKDLEVASSLARLKIVKDSNLILSASSSAAEEALHETTRKSSRARLAGSLKALGRADEALSQDELLDADFWLLSAALDFARAWLYSREVTPAPSHMLAQLRQDSQRSPGMYEAYSSAAGLGRASRDNCVARLESLSVLYDVLEAPAQDSEATSAESFRVAFEVVKGKSAQLMKSIQHADCYSFLGYQAAELIPSIVHEKRGRRPGSGGPSLISLLSKGRDRLLGENVIGGLGLGRDRRAMQDSLSLLRNQLSVLARKG